MNTNDIEKMTEQNNKNSKSSILDNEITDKYKDLDKYMSNIFMNTSDMDCVKMTEQNNKSSDPKYIAIELEFRRKNWYDRVYLCYEDTNFRPSNTYDAIKGFDCYRYNSFYNADYAWINCRQELHKLKVRHTMIPICRWVPEIFDRYILNWKLRNMYWGGQISMGRGYNRYK